MTFWQKITSSVSFRAALHIFPDVHVASIRKCFHFNRTFYYQPHHCIYDRTLRTHTHTNTHFISLCLSQCLQVHSSFTKVIEAFYHFWLSIWKHKILLVRYDGLYVRSNERVSLPFFCLPAQNVTFGTEKVS